MIPCFSRKSGKVLLSFFQQSVLIKSTSAKTMTLKVFAKSSPLKSPDVRNRQSISIVLVNQKQTLGQWMLAQVGYSYWVHLGYCDCIMWTMAQMNSKRQMRAC